MFKREKTILTLLLSAAMMFTSVNPVLAAGNWTDPKNDEPAYFKSWKVDFGSYYNYTKDRQNDHGDEFPQSDDTIYLTSPVETLGEKRPALISGNLPRVSTVSVDVVDIEELTTDVEIRVGEEFFYTDEENTFINHSELSIHTDGRASARVHLNGYENASSGEKEAVLSANNTEEQTVTVKTEYGSITCTASKTENDLTVFKFDHHSLIQEAISRNEPTRRITKTGFLENLPDCSISFNSMVSSYAFYGVNKKNCRQVFGDIIVSFNGISYVASDVKLIRYKYKGEGIIYESFFLQIKKIERAGFDADGKVILTDSQTLSKEEKKFDKKLLKILKKATKPYRIEAGEIDKEGVMELDLYRYQLTGNNGDGEYQYSVVKKNGSKGTVTIKFNINGKTASVKNGKRQNEEKSYTDPVQIVRFDGNSIYVKSTRLYGDIDA